MTVSQTRQGQQGRSFATMLLVSSVLTAKMSPGGFAAAYVPAAPSRRAGVATRRTISPSIPSGSSLGQRCESVSVHSPSSTVLQYMDTHDGDCVTASNSTSGWLGSVFRGPFKSMKSAQPNEGRDDRREVLDDHLEFLQRRYHRLHESSEEATVTYSGHKSIWGWLSNGGDDGISNQRQEDALVVLGLAEVASRNALLKHSKNNTPVRKFHRNAVRIPHAVVVDAEAHPVVPETPTPAVTSQVAPVIKAIPLAILSARFAMNIGVLLLGFVKKMIAAATQLFSEIRRSQPSSSVEVMMASASAVLLVLRPVLMHAAENRGQRKEKVLFHNTPASV